MNIPSSIITLLFGVLLTLISLWYGQNHNLLPIQASEEAPLVDDLFNMMMTISTGLFLMVQGILVYSLFKFRRQPGDDSDGPYIEGNIPLEILWTSIPAVIVLGIAIYSFEVYNQMGGLNPMDHSVAHGHSTHQVATMPGSAIAAPLLEDVNSNDVNGNVEVITSLGTTTETNTPTKTEAISAETTDTETTAIPVSSSASQTDPIDPKAEMVIQVTGLQYAWLFTYPNSGVVAGELHVPVGRTIRLDISANDVLHAFWVPEFRVKQDAIPGAKSELRFRPSRIGEYPVICAELCGPYHGAMKTKVIAETQSDFDAWLASQQVASGTDHLEHAIALQQPQTKTPSSAHQSSPDQFLAPFVDNLGIHGTEIVNQLHPDHSSSSAAL